MPGWIGKKLKIQSNPRLARRAPPPHPAFGPLLPTGSDFNDKQRQSGRSSVLTSELSPLGVELLFSSFSWSEGEFEHNVKSH